MLIADRNNDRLLIVSPAKRIVWSFPRPHDVRPGQSFHDPDDAFFTPGYRAISINEEFNETASLIDVRSHRIVWSFGHPGVAGSAFGYLSNPDDAYLLPNGELMVADIRNCRVLFIDHAKRVVRELSALVSEADDECQLVVGHEELDGQRLSRHCGPCFGDDPHLQIFLLDGAVSGSHVLSDPALLLGRGPP